MMLTSNVQVNNVQANSQTNNSYAIASRSGYQPKGPISVNDAENITYKIKLSTVKLDVPAIDKTIGDRFINTLNQTHSQQKIQVKNYRAELVATGMEQNSRDIIYLGDKPLIEVNQQGFVGSSNSLSQFVNQHIDEIRQGDMSGVMAQLEQRYGSDVRLENFAPGQGPTNAELFNLFNDDLSFNQYVDQEITALNQELLNTQLRVDNFDKQQQAFDSVPQQAVFRVNNVIVGTLDTTGKLRIMSSNVMAASDDAGLARDNLRDYFNVPFGSEQDVSSVNGMLEKIFGDQVEVAQFSADNAPSFGTINAQASEQASQRQAQLSELLKLT